MTLLADVTIPMRDGTTTVADVWLRPDSIARPAVVQRSPYGKALSTPLPLLDPRVAVDAGFVLVVQDVRGTGGSEGSFEPFADDKSDGFDTIEWVAAQPWCNGQVASVGGSYCGANQWLALDGRPPHLFAIAPALATAGAGSYWAFTGPVKETGFLASWIAAALLPPTRRRLDRLADVLANPSSLEGEAAWVDAWLREPADADYWAPRTSTAALNLVDNPADAVPAFIIGGWYDRFVNGTVATFQNRAHPDDRLVLGPWGHDIRLAHLVGEADLGVAGAGSAVGVDRRMFEFLASAAAGRPEPGRRVAAYVLGAKCWIEADSWPPDNSAPVTLQLEGDGAFAVDPADLPTTPGGRGLLVSVPGGGFGPRDITSLRAREDVVTLTAQRAPDLAEAVFAGPVCARLEVAPTTSGGDDETQDWVTILATTTVDGRLLQLCEGITRAPANATAVRVDLGHVCIQLDPGQQLVALVSGGASPRWQPPAQGAEERRRRAIRPGSRLELRVITRLHSDPQPTSSNQQQK